MKKIITLFVSAFVSVGAFAQWDTLTTNTFADFNSIYFSNDTNGVVVGENSSGRGDSYHTVDGGASWIHGTNANNAPSYNDAAFVSLYLAWVVTDSGCVLQSSDEGLSWYYSTQLTNSDLNCICKATDTILYIGGDNGVLFRSPDFGLSWDTLNSGTSLAINDMYFQDGLNGWIVGDGGYMAATADGGQTWIMVTQPYFGFFNCNGFAYAGTSPDAFAVGNMGDMIHSADGGVNWSAFSSATSYNLNSVRFGNDLAGIVCGDHGTIRRSNDGGTSWGNESMSYVTQNLNKVFFVNPTLAFICGDSGRVLKSNIDISSVPTNPVSSFEISAFPNPFADVLNIVIDLEKNSAVQLVIMDLSGRIVLQENEGELNAGKQIIHPQGISSLVNGMYLVKVMVGDLEMVIPVVKN